MARLPLKWQGVAMMLVIVPFWTSFLIRIYAWINILQHDGLLNKILLALHVVSAPVVWLSTDSAMYLGIVYSYLPFMILPLYATLAKTGPGAAGGGRRSRRLAAAIVLAGDVSAVAARASGPGSLLCFIPIVGEFVIPDLLAGSDSLMIGQTLWLEFFTNKDWPVASATAVVLLVLLVAPMLLYDRLQRRQLEATAMTARPLRRIVTLQSHRNRVRDRVSLSADRHPDHLFVQRLAAGDGVGRLVTALVRRILDGRAIWMRRHLFAVAAVSATLATLLGTLAALTLTRRRFRGRPLFSGMIYAPLVMPEVITGLSLLLLFVAGYRRPRLLDRDDRPHHADHVLRRRGGAVAARRAGPQPGGSGDGPRLRSGRGRFLP